MHRGWLGPAFTACVAMAVAAVVGYVIWQAVNDPGHGTITGRHYRPGYSTYSCSGSSRNRSCSNYWHDACYDIKYSDGKHDGDACVAPQDWNRYQVGGQYP